MDTFHLKISKILCFYLRGKWNCYVKFINGCCSTICKTELFKILNNVFFIYCIFIFFLSPDTRINQPVFLENKRTKINVCHQILQIVCLPFKAITILKLELMLYQSSWNSELLLKTVLTRIKTKSIPRLGHHFYVSTILFTENLFFFQEIGADFCLYDIIMEMRRQRPAIVQTRVRNWAIKSPGAGEGEYRI